MAEKLADQSRREGTIIEPGMAENQSQRGRRYAQGGANLSASEHSRNPGWGKTKTVKPRRGGTIFLTPDSGHPFWGFRIYQTYPKPLVTPIAE
jgi:hypothetical protein